MCGGYRVLQASPSATSLIIPEHQLNLAKAAASLPQTIHFSSLAASIQQDNEEEKREAEEEVVEPEVEVEEAEPELLPPIRFSALSASILDQQQQQQQEVELEPELDVYLDTKVARNRRRERRLRSRDVEIGFPPEPLAPPPPAAKIGEPRRRRRHYAGDVHVADIEESVLEPLTGLCLTPEDEVQLGLRDEVVHEEVQDPMVKIVARKRKTTGGGTYAQLLKKVAASTTPLVNKEKLLIASEPGLLKEVRALLAKVFIN